MGLGTSLPRPAGSPICEPSLTRRLVVVLEVCPNAIGSLASEIQNGDQETHMAVPPELALGDLAKANRLGMTVEPLGIEQPHRTAEPRRFYAVTLPDGSSHQTDASGVCDEIDKIEQPRRWGPPRRRSPSDVEMSRADQRLWAHVRTVGDAIAADRLSRVGAQGRSRCSHRPSSRPSGPRIRSSRSSGDDGGGGGSEPPGGRPARGRCSLGPDWTGDGTSGSGEPEVARPPKRLGPGTQPFAQHLLAALHRLAGLARGLA